MKRVNWSIQLRLTLLYGGLFLLAGAVLLTIVYVLVAHSLGWVEVAPPSTPDLGGLPPLDVPDPQVSDHFALQRASDLRKLLVASGLALAGMTVVSVGLGRLTAQRALRPLRTMAVQAKDISERNLHSRLDVRGPQDEIKDLADTFDGLLSRLEGAFEAQRRFVANASHELRTPLTLERSLLEIALADPDATAGELRETCRRVLAGNQEQERLIEALLTLARSQRGLDRRTALDLAVAAADTAEHARSTAAAHGHAVRVEADLRPAPTDGDLPLVERLIANLVDNAVRYNRPDGWVRISTGWHDGRPTLFVANSGPVIAPDQVDALFQPFHRLTGNRTGHASEGLGVGLSIVEAIATAHDATLTVRPLPEGGLQFRVAFRTTTLPECTSPPKRCGTSQGPTALSASHH